MVRRVAVSFSERLVGIVAGRSSQVVLGLDPDPARLLPQALQEAQDGTPAERAARAVTSHCRALINAAGPACAAVKLQLACFERLGAPGWRALADTTSAAQSAGLLVIADGKRGDVPHTMEAYAQALLGETPTPWGPVRGLGADAVTANPVLGRDALQPLVDAARAGNAGVFVLVRTSNPGAGELQDADSGGAAWHERLARMVGELDRGQGELSDVGAVVGATEPGLLNRLRMLMPRAPFLLPGVGAQGGRVDELGAAFAPGRAAGLVTASRSIVGPALESGDAHAAREAAERLREEAWALSG
jgi:orotidine-5'-phosphate decarboxylase